MDVLPRVAHGAGQIASHDAVLNANVARIVLPVDEGGPISLPDVSQRGKRYLMAIRVAYQEISDLVSVRTELWLSADYKVKRLLALNHLGSRLPPTAACTTASTSATLMP